jgi:hypothetical protein
MIKTKPKGQFYNKSLSQNYVCFHVM